MGYRLFYCGSSESKQFDPAIAPCGFAAAQGPQPACARRDGAKSDTMPHGFFGNSIAFRQPRRDDRP